MNTRVLVATSAFLVLAQVTIFGCSRSPLTAAPVASAFGQGVYKGTPVTPSGQVWKSSVTLEVEGGRICSATLISKEYVLSAAHCVQAFAPVKINFYDGTNTVVGSLPVTEKHVHPDFHGGAEDDLLIVRFSGALPTTNHHAVPLLADAEALQVNGALVIAGTGLVGASQYNGLTYAYLGITEVDDRYVVASDATGAQSACLGDSGGSGYVKMGAGWALAGVTKSIDTDISCTHAAEHTTFTLVSRYAAWIKSVISKSGGDPASFLVN